MVLVGTQLSRARLREECRRERRVGGLMRVVGRVVVLMMLSLAGLDVPVPGFLDVGRPIPMRQMGVRERIKKRQRQEQSAQEERYAAGPCHFSTGHQCTSYDREPRP